MGKYLRSLRLESAAYTSRVSLNITHMQLVGEEESHPEDLYGIPDNMLHNRTVSRVTDTPQSSGYQRSESNPSHANLTDDLDSVHDEISQNLTHISDSMIATQRLPSQSQQDRPVKKMRLSWSWAQRIENKSVQYPVPEVDMDAHVVHCQCGFAREEGEMVSMHILREVGVVLTKCYKQVQCSFCNTWAHLHCYGYLSQEFPEVHACYRCLFESYDDARLGELQDLALTRRCLWMLYGHDPPQNQAGLARSLGKSWPVAI
ncbi:MAG: hypothetical protein Q9218_000311 [Villophora microphyllina]